MNKMNNVERECLTPGVFSVFRISTLFLTGILLLAGCSFQHTSEMQRKLVYRSLPEHPAWITELPTDPDYFFAVGISANAPSLQQGRLSAARDAAVEVSNYLGLKASARFEVETTELTTRIINEMTITTSAKLERSTLSQMYYEEFHHAGVEEKANIYDVYVLLRIPMAELLQEQARQELRKAGILSEVKVTSLEAQKHFRAGNFPLAWQKWILALRLLDEEVGDSISSLQIYKTLLTAVEGIKLSVSSGENSQANKTASSVTAYAIFAGENGDIPLKGLALHFRLSKDKMAGKITVTNSSGRVKYPFPTSTVSGLEVRLVMSPYAVDRTGLSLELSQKINFLEAMLAGKVAQYGSVVFAKQKVYKSPFQGAVLMGQEGGLIKVDVATSNPYILIGAREKYYLTAKVDIMPALSENMRRPPLNLSVVIDKSSSMNEDGKIDYTKKAAEFLIDHLTPNDYLSIVAYNTEVEVVMPAGPVSFQGLLKHHLSEIDPDGMTNLSGGLFEGYTQVKKHVNADGVNRILLLSDGKANRGITHSEGLTPYTKQYGEEGIAVSALGVGQDFNEELLMALAETSNGNYYYIKNPEDIPVIFSQELTRLINVAAQNVLVSVKLRPDVHLSNSFGHPYIQISQDEYQFRLGDINYGGRGILLLELSVPPEGEGEKNIAVVEVSYDDVGGGGRVKSTKQVSAIYTRNEGLIASSKNQGVEKYVLLTRSIEQLEKVLQSMDRGLYEEAIESLRYTYASLDAFARVTEDPEFIQRMKFLKHFEHEIEELQDSNALHEHEESVKKKLGYQLYLEKHSHRSLDHPLHPSEN
ncbi:MAG: hypothetical protein BMS9Abin19_0366 [Gammaproteobacteria bacterium]|nr:MAG: hypothetical protein BMS9Abin19_0366 [Gammaproteobacteria bacterium]